MTIANISGKDTNLYLPYSGRLVIQERGEQIAIYAFSAKTWSKFASLFIPTQKIYVETK